MTDPLLAHVGPLRVGDDRAAGAATARRYLWPDWEPQWAVVGPVADAARLAGDLLAEGTTSVSLPVTALDAVGVPAGWSQVTWSFRWTDRAPAYARAAAWLPASSDGDVSALLDAGFPDASVRPGQPVARRWCAIAEDDRLVACAGDATVSAEVGFLVSIASAPDLRRTGLGRDVTAWATEALLAEHPVVGLWHMGDNTAAAAAYTSLGFRDEHRMVHLAPKPPPTSAVCDP